MSTRTVDHACVTLAVEDAGEGIPIVLLHGLTATRRYVVMGSKLLERSGHRVISYDARGHGESSPAPAADAYDYRDLAADLGAVLDALDVERAVLAGASMGAHTLLRYALDHPGRVAGVVAITPAALPGKRDLRHWDRLAAGLRSGGIDGFVAAYDLDAVPERWRATIETVLRQRLARHEHLDAVADALETVPRSDPFADLGELASLAAPAIVVGDRDEADPEHPLATAEAYAAAIPGAELRVEDPGASPLAWQGAQLSRLIAELAERAAVA